jgi:SHS2 domain-containing protein
VYRWVEHTGELEIEIEAPTIEDVFADALTAFEELLRNGAAEGETATHEINLEGDDTATLLADFLSELVFLAETEGFIPERLIGAELSGQRLRATVQGRRGEPSSLVKAVTYHHLQLRRERDGWSARLVLDV